MKLGKLSGHRGGATYLGSRGKDILVDEGGERVDVSFYL